MAETSWTTVAEESCATDMIASGSCSGEATRLRKQEERELTARMAHPLTARCPGSSVAAGLRLPQMPGGSLDGDVAEILTACRFDDV